MMTTEPTQNTELLAAQQKKERDPRAVLRLCLAALGLCILLPLLAGLGGWLYGGRNLVQFQAGFYALAVSPGCVLSLIALILYAVMCRISSESCRRTCGTVSSVLSWVVLGYGLILLTPVLPSILGGIIKKVLEL